MPDATAHGAIFHQVKLRSGAPIRPTKPTNRALLTMLTRRQTVRGVWSSDCRERESSHVEVSVLDGLPQRQPVLRRRQRVIRVQQLGCRT